MEYQIRIKMQAETSQPPPTPLINPNLLFNFRTVATATSSRRWRAGSSGARLSSFACPEAVGDDDTVMVDTRVPPCEQFGVFIISFNECQGIQFSTNAL